MPFDQYGSRIPLMSSRKDETAVTFEKKCVRLHYQFLLVMYTNCKHFYSFLGPYMKSLRLRLRGSRSGRGESVCLNPIAFGNL